MKMRSSTASRGTCMGSSSGNERAGGEAGPDRQQAQRHRAADVAERSPPVTVAGESQRLQAEGREGGVAAAQADQEKLAHRQAAGKCAARRDDGGEDANDQAAADIDHQGAPGK